MVEATSPDQFKASLAAFFEKNPEATLETRPDGPAISHPWGDPTVEILLSEDGEKLIECLNSVRLPPLFSAVVHLDLSDVEFIWTAFPVPDEMRTRSFEFRFCGSSFQCRFAGASERLLAIAKGFRPVGSASETDYRNLRDLSLYFRFLKSSAAQGPKARAMPTSFWMHVEKWEEAGMVDLARNLNFFTRYFDRRAPRIIIHEDLGSGADTPAPVLFPLGSFPDVINGQALDPYLLGLWETATLGDAFKRFLYCYQILEYAAFYYLREESLEQVRRLLLSPELHSRVGRAAEQVLEVVASERVNDETKVSAVVGRLVDPEMIWKELAPHMGSFSHDTAFDGGFKLPALLREGWTLDDFRSMWIPKFPDSLRKIRNALVHSREFRMVGVIAPTRSNIDRLKPWLGPIYMAAMQVMMFRQRQSE